MTQSSLSTAAALLEFRRIGEGRVSHIYTEGDIVEVDGQAGTVHKLAAAVLCS